MTTPQSVNALTKTFHMCRARLLGYLVSAFPRLANDADDILQNVWLEAHRRIADEAQQPPENWESWLRCVVRSRAIDHLRVLERHIFLNWPGVNREDTATTPWEPADNEADGPSQKVLERERRQRQGLLLSDVLAEFCRWCEKRPQRLAIKEAYERSLHGQSPGAIATAMGASADNVYQWLHQAREWVRQRLAEKDVDRSVFLTLYGRK